ncbi:hypothetical protein DFAR_2180002 [Desulfarculales bacterium]
MTELKQEAIMNAGELLALAWGLLFFVLIRRRFSDYLGLVLPFSFDQIN